MVTEAMKWNVLRKITLTALGLVLVSFAGVSFYRSFEGVVKIQPFLFKLPFTSL